VAEIRHFREPIHRPPSGHRVLAPRRVRTLDTDFSETFRRLLLRLRNGQHDAELRQLQGCRQCEEASFSNGINCLTPDESVLAPQQLQHFLQRVRVQHVNRRQPSSASLVDPCRDEVQFADTVSIRVHRNLDAGILGELGVLIG